MKYKKLTFSSSSLKPHYFIGSKIRGALGYALKDEVCINPSYKCKGCFAAEKCPFYLMYEQENKTHKYRLDFVLDDNKFRFSLLLFDELIQYANKITIALLSSLSEFRDIAVTEENLTLEIAKYPSIIKLEFLTPLRIKSNNTIAKNDIEILQILSSINKRYYDITGQAYQKLNISQDYKLITSHLQYKPLLRQSNRQKRKMDLGGLMGEIVISNIDKKSYELLKLGEIIGVGKNTVFGLGRINVEDIDV